MIVYRRACLLSELCGLKSAFIADFAPEIQPARSSRKACFNLELQCSYGSDLQKIKKTLKISLDILNRLHISSLSYT